MHPSDPWFEVVSDQAQRIHSLAVAAWEYDPDEYDTQHQALQDRHSEAHAYAIAQVQALAWGQSITDPILSRANLTPPVGRGEFGQYRIALIERLEWIGRTGRSCLCLQRALPLPAMDEDDRAMLEEERRERLYEEVRYPDY